MIGRVDFSNNASRYDARHGATIGDDVADALVRAASLTPGTRVLDVAAGTGRVAIPLTSRGCRVVALDLARPMLDQLAKKSPSSRLQRVVGVGEQLPFAGACFDAVVIARLLYLVPEWKELLKDVRRVLKPGGRVLHEWSNGEPDEEWVQIREKIRAMFEAEGIAHPFHPGVRTEEEVDVCLANLGMTRIASERFGGGHLMTIADFMNRLVGGEFSFTWAVPKDIAARCLKDLQSWAAARFDLDREVPMPREILWRVYER